MRPRTLHIGEASQGHSFTTTEEGAIPLRVRGEAIPLFGRAIYAEQVGENLMSVSEAVDRGFTVVFTKDAVEFHKAATVRVPDNPILKGVRSRNRLFYVEFPSPSADQRENAKLSNHVSTFLSHTYSEYVSEYDMWHARLGHVNPRLLAMAVPGVVSARDKRNCDVCTRGKIHRQARGPLKRPHPGCQESMSAVISSAPWPKASADRSMLPSMLIIGANSCM